MTKNKLVKVKLNDKKGDQAMLEMARLQLLLEKNMHWFATKSNEPNISPRIEILQECYKAIKKAKIPKKYLIAESLAESID